MTKTVLYARVSTTDQTLSHQKTQAEAHGYVLDKVIADDGVSGRIPLRERTEGKRLFDLLGRGDILVVRWVDRLGRDYNDVSDSIRAFMRDGVVIKTIINNMVFDGATKDPIQMAVRDALIAFMAATAQAQYEATKEAQRAGIAAARADTGKFLGRKPSYTREQFEEVIRRLDIGQGTSEISRGTELTRQTVLRIKADPAKAEQALSQWGLGGSLMHRLASN